MDLNLFILIWLTGTLVSCMIMYWTQQLPEIESKPFWNNFLWGLLDWPLVIGIALWGLLRGFTNPVEEDDDEF